MARAPKSENNIQVFRGSRPKADVFATNAGGGCCNTGFDFNYDKLAERVRFDNGLKHLSPAGGVERYRFPGNHGFNDDKAAILKHINDVGVGATISVIAIPTYAFVTGVGIHIEAEEEGLTFDLITRNGLLLPVPDVITATGGGEDPVVVEIEPGVPIRVDVEQGDGLCEVTRTLGAGSFTGFGALADGVLFADIFGRNANGSFALEADELILRVASMPAGDVPVTGKFDITVSASYDVIHRAER